MYLSIIFLPLLGCIVSGFFGRKVGIRGAEFVTSLSVIITTLLSILCFIEVGFNSIPVIISLFRWIDSEWFNIIWGFLFDSLTVSMLIPVLIISSLVHIYSISYMSNDPHIQRFFSYLSLFTFMMVILVTGSNYLLMFVGWEGVGVCSYLLVSFWFTRIAANQSSISAFLANRVGDCFLTIGMFATLWSLGNLDYSTVFSLAPYINNHVISIIGICLLIGAMAKSSQVGLHIWLPMAMEGPTPVSALIHAATMVTAGVYLLMRSSPLIEFSNIVLLLSLWLGAITTVFSSLIGLFQQDIKKVIAYSTMSQLGMMVMSIGLSSYNIALFHLMNHAFYKALLFLGAGSVIHAVADNQDFRKFGGLISYLPLTYSVMLIASLSLVAFPFMTGFYSKDFILESAYGQFSFSGIAVYIIATIGAIFTTLYSVKVLYLTFLVNPNGPRIYYSLPIDNLFNSTKSYKPAHEGDLFLSLPLVILALFSIFFGFITKDIFIGLGSNFFADNSLFIHPIHEIMIDTEFAVSVLFKLLPFICTISFSILALTLSELFSELIIYFKLSRLGYNIFGFFNQRFLIEFFYNKYITNLILNLGGQITKILDKGSIEFFGPFGLEKGLLRLSKNISYLSTSNVTTYALYILVSFIIYIIIYYVQYNICILLVIMLLSIGNGDKKTDIAREIDYNYYNKQLLKNPITYIYNSKKMFSTSAYLLNSSDSDSSSDSESVDNSNPVYSGDESAPVPAPSSVPANNNNNNNENNNNNNDNGDSNYESDASSDSATTSSSINTVFNKLKDKSDEEINQYFEDKQRKLDRTRDQEQANNSPISDFDYVDEIADQIDAKHEDRSKALQDRKEIVKEYVDAYRNDRNVFEDMDVDRSQSSEGETLKEDSTNKRKFEEESEDEGQPSEAKRPKQDSSDITGDTEPFDFGGGDD